MQGTKILLNSIVVSFIIAIILFLALVSFAPDSSPYSTNNYGWNGLQELNSKYQLQEVNSLSSIQNRKGSIMLEMAPTTSFSNSSIELAKIFVQNGGTLVVADSTTLSNSLLQGLGLHIQIVGNIVEDPVYNWQSETQPTAPISSFGNQGHSLLSGVVALAFTFPSSLTISSPLYANAIALSSPNSFAKTSSGSRAGSGPFPLIASENLGAGRVIVIGDSNFFINSVWTHANNQVFVNNLLANSTVYLDTSQWPSNSQASVRSSLLSAYAYLSSVPYRYVVAALFIGASIIIVQAMTASNISSKKTKTIIQTRASSFNKDIIERVRRDREKFGTTHE